MRRCTVSAFLCAVTFSFSLQAAELREQFSFGINYAWQHYSGDFGGISGWAKQGVSEDPSAYAAELNDMAAHGVKVVRWWVWPELWTDAITFSGDGTPQPLGQTAINDALKALELASNADIRIMFCLFSFDGFRPTRESYGINMTGYRDIVIDDGKRAALMQNIVKPFAEALQRSPHLDALHSWDVINEPEWAITGANKYGGQDFDPDPDLEHVSHDQMEVFLKDTLAVLRSATPDVPLSIGSAAMKWAFAWRDLDVDFYQIHIYDWVNDYWPYSNSPADFGMADKPMIMGEYPVEGLRSVSHEQLLSSWYNNGYAGALGWDYRVTHGSGLSAGALADRRRGYLQELGDFAAAELGSAPATTPSAPASGPANPGSGEEEVPSIGAALGGAGDHGNEQDPGDSSTVAEPEVVAAPLTTPSAPSASLLEKSDEPPPDEVEQSEPAGAEQR